MQRPEDPPRIAPMHHHRRSAPALIVVGVGALLLGMTLPRPVDLPWVAASPPCCGHHPASASLPGPIAPPPPPSTTAEVPVRLTVEFPDRRCDEPTPDADDRPTPTPVPPIAPASLADAGLMPTPIPVPVPAFDPAALLPPPIADLPPAPAVADDRAGLPGPDDPDGIVVLAREAESDSPGDSPDAAEHRAPPRPSRPGRPIETAAAPADDRAPAPPPVTPLATAPRPPSAPSPTPAPVDPDRARLEARMAEVLGPDWKAAGMVPVVPISGMPPGASAGGSRPVGVPRPPSAPSPAPDPPVDAQGVAESRLSGTVLLPPDDSHTPPSSTSGPAIEDGPVAPTESEIARLSSDLIRPSPAPSIARERPLPDPGLASRRPPLGLAPPADPGVSRAGGEGRSGRWRWWNRREP